MNPMVFAADDDGLPVETAGAPTAAGVRPDSPLEFRVFHR